MGPGPQPNTVQIKSNDSVLQHPAALIERLSRPIPTIPDSLECLCPLSPRPRPCPHSHPDGSVEHSPQQSNFRSTPQFVRPMILKQTHHQFLWTKSLIANK